MSFLLLCPAASCRHETPPSFLWLPFSGAPSQKSPAVLRAAELAEKRAGQQCLHGCKPAQLLSA